MIEYIEREAAKRAAHMAFVRRGDALQYSEVMHQLAKLPAADVRPVVRGEWEKFWVIEDEIIGDGFYAPQCSVCKARGAYRSNFCPNCGADMRGENDV